MKKRLALIGFAASLVMVLGAGTCDKFTEPFKDAPRSGVDNGTPADVIRMPDGFSNASTKCDHGNRIYIAYHGDRSYASVAVVPQDPTCRRANG